MKIWVDDIREPPNDYTRWNWYQSSNAVLETLSRYKRLEIPSYSIEVMSLDHDLGGDDTTRPIVLWMCEHNFWPVEVRVHSANPVGRDWLEGMIERYKC